MSRAVKVTHIYACREEYRVQYSLLQYSNSMYIYVTHSRPEDISIRVRRMCNAGEMIKHVRDTWGRKRGKCKQKAPWHVAILFRLSSSTIFSFLPMLGWDYSICYYYPWSFLLLTFSLTHFIYICILCRWYFLYLNITNGMVRSLKLLYFKFVLD